MRNHPSKKQIILDLARDLGLQRARESDLRRIQASVRRARNGGTSLSYIAGVLREAGVTVEYQDRFAVPAMEEPYAGRLRDALKFSDLAAAEESLRKLFQIFCEYRAASDRQGTSLVRSMVLRGKERAISLSRNPRVSPEKRREKEEIAHWFHVWLETTDLFFDWLELRKASPEFRRKFPDREPRNTLST